MSSDSNVKALETWVKTSVPCYEYMDLSIDSVDDGVFRVSVPLTDNTKNHVKMVHALFQFSAAEFLGGLIVLTTRSSEKFIPVLRNMQIEYSIPAYTDITAEALFSDEQVAEMNAAMQKDGRYDFELKVSIKNIEGEIVAKTHANYAVRIFE